MIEFNLKEKRREMEKQILMGAIDIRKVFGIVEKQDKKFLSLLTEELRLTIKENNGVNIENFNWIEKDIDGLSGYEPSPNSSEEKKNGN